MIFLWISFLIIPQSWAGNPGPYRPPVNCGCATKPIINSCGIQPARMSKPEIEISREFGFEVPADHLVSMKPKDENSLLQLFTNFLENSDHARALNPEYYTRAAKDAAVLTLKTTFVPKNPGESDEYLRCILPSDKYCLYRSSLRPYIGLAAKVSGIPFSFLACQAYGESRFNSNARSSVGAIGYAQIRENNIEYLNEILERSIRSSSINRSLAVESGPRAARIKKSHQAIAELWKQFWAGTKKAPTRLEKCDLTCYRQVFLAQALSLKTDMLALVTSSKGLVADYDEIGNFKIEKMDKGDSLLLLAGSYNLGVSNMIRLVSEFCSNSTKLKDCLDRMQNGKLANPIQEQARKRDVPSFRNYVMRIRDCSQRFSAEQLDFEDDDRWTHDTRAEMHNQQRENVVQCLANPCSL